MIPAVTATDLEDYRRAKDLLFHLVEITAGSREYHEDVIQEAEALAHSLREEVSQQVGRSQFTVMDLEKKGIVLRQKYDMARALTDGVQRASLVKRWMSQKRTLVEYLVGGVTTVGVSALVGLLSWRAVLDSVLLPTATPRLPDLLTAPLNPEGLPIALAAGAIVSLLGLFSLYALTRAFLLRRQLLLAQRDPGQKRPVQIPLAA